MIEKDDKNSIPHIARAQTTKLLEDLPDYVLILVLPVIFWSFQNVDK